MKLSTFLRFALAAELAAGAGLAALVWPQAGWPAYLLAALAVPVVGTGIVLAIQFLVGAVLDPRQPRLGLLATVPLWLHETGVSLRVFCWRQPFASNFAEPEIRPDPTRPALLLIHGYVCNRAVWKPLLDSGRLAQFNVATVNLEPVFGSIDAYADVIAQAVEQLRTRSGAAHVHLIGHSMGGIAARAYLRRHGDAAVGTIITIASPHHGTVFGRLGHGLNARQMAHASAYMQALGNGLTDAQRARFICFASRDDNLIVPRSSPLLPGADHRVFEGIGHLAMIESPRVWDAILVELAQRTQAPPASATRSAA